MATGITGHHDGLAAFIHGKGARRAGDHADPVAVPVERAGCAARDGVDGDDLAASVNDGGTTSGQYRKNGKQ